MKKSCYDGMIGLALADAMGVPVEFEERDYLKKHPVTGVMGYGTYSVPKGFWSDDTSLAIATMDGIIKNSGIINEKAYTNIADNFVSYLEDSSFTPGDKIFDIGNTTRQAIIKLKIGSVPPTLAGGTLPHNTGNGALMRILPIAYYASQNNLTDRETEVIVNDISSLTHRLDTCKLGAYIYTQFARQLIEGASKEDAYNHIQQLDYSSYPQDIVNSYSRVLKNDIRNYHEKDISSKGKTLPTLEATLWSFMTTENYHDAVLKAINLGEDTDTIGACVGGLSGAYYGADSIDKSWLSHLAKHDYLKDLFETYDKSIQDRCIPLNFIELEKQGKPNRIKKAEEQEKSNETLLNLNSKNLKTILGTFSDNFLR